MDLINDAVEERNDIVNLKRVRKGAKSIMSQMTQVPHGLFYRTEGRSKMSLLTNLSIDMSTESSSTILEWVYDENISSTEDTRSTGTFTMSDFENVTELPLFTKTINTSKANLTPKKPGMESCECNILHNTCDINCCCDSDCSEAEIELFKQNCEEASPSQNKEFISPCDSDEWPNKNPTSFLENLFCISKSNLPDKRLTDIQFDEAAIGRYPRWRTSGRRQATRQIRVYKYNDPIRLTYDEYDQSTAYADIPMTLGNNYCNDKKPIRFLKNESIKCIVKLQDLHMFQAINNTDGRILSVARVPRNTTKGGINETRLFHTAWTVMFCDESRCRSYERSADEPRCTDSRCDNIATALHYIIYYYESRVTRAVLTLNVQSVPMRLPFLTQHVTVTFFLSNSSVQDIVQLSGNPGYKQGLPVIVSTADGNHTFHFFNSNTKKSLTYPDNRSGRCISSNVTYKVVQFGRNERSKCTLHVQKVDVANGTRACHAIQAQILRLLGAGSALHVCPYGDPTRARDDLWLRMRLDETSAHGLTDMSHLTCFDLVTRIGYVFGYAETEDASGNQIIFARLEGTAHNVTFDVEDMRVPLTLDTRFLQLGRAHAQFAGAPRSGLALPRGFLLPSAGYRRAPRFFLALLPLFAFQQ